MQFSHQYIYITSKVNADFSPVFIEYLVKCGILQDLII